MKSRRLGKSGPRVSALGMGRGSQAVQLGTPAEREFNDAVRRAIDLGIAFFDSSDLYWEGRHEALLGRALQGRRHDVLIATKFGLDGKSQTNGKPEHVFRSCEASLERLGTDVIDVYYIHRVDPATPIAETVGAMSRLVEQGKVRYLGLCEAGERTLRRAHSIHPLAALQTEYSLWARECEAEILPLCRELGIAFVAYAPLGRGLLTGAIKSVEDFPDGDRRRKHPRFLPENLARNVELVAQLAAMAARKGVTPAQLALAWLLAQGEDIVPIPGTNHTHNVELNAAAVDIAMTKSEVDELSRVFAPGSGAGARYSPSELKSAGI